MEISLLLFWNSQSHPGLIPNNSKFQQRYLGLCVSRIMIAAMEKLKVLVTGCAGFIGSHVTENLLNHGCKVSGIDNLEDFYDPSIKRHNLTVFEHHPSFSFHPVDLREPQKIGPILAREKPDVVLHLAAKGGVRPSILHPQAYLESNLSATNHLLEAMRLHDVTKLIFASSSSVYGNHPSVPFSETVTGLKPISPYAFTKLAGELLTYTYHHLYQLDVVNLRFFTVFGPRQRPDLAIYKFTQKLFNGQPIDVYGDGQTARDYTYVSDIVQGILLSINYVHKHQSVYETINLGNDYPVDLNSMISAIEQAAERRFVVHHAPMQPGDVERTWADITKAKTLLNYHPKTSFIAGIQQFVAWYRQNFKEDK